MIALGLAALSLLASGKEIAPSGLQWPVKIGANLEGITDWSFSNVFVDLVKQSRGFGPPDAPWTGKVPVDANGWPTTDFGVILATWPGMRGIGGTYRIACRCRTTPKIGLVSSPGTIRNLARDPATGIVTADLDYPATGPQLMLSFRDTAGGVRDLRVLRPGSRAGETFTKPFLDQCSRFANLRFMDFAATNGSPVRHWSDRTLPSSPSYSNAAGAQVPWEVCIALCNRLKEDAWINVPHQADDDYVANLARLFHRTLDPKLNVYVEYSNEVWNWSFAQATWNKNQAAADVKAGDPDLNYDHVNDPNVFSARRIAKRIKTISDIFGREYGQSGAPTTVRPVLATQISWPAYWLLDGLTFLNDRFGPPARYIYACAGAPYFNLGDTDKRTDLSKAEVLNAMRASIEAQKSDLTIEACATMSRFYHLGFLGYEGGPDTFGPNNVQAKKAASLDPAMQQVCVDYLDEWFGYGFGMINWFVAGATNYDGQYGTWGLTNDMTNLDSPKIRAIDQVRTEGTATLKQGIPVPGPVDPRRFAFRDAKWQTSSPLVLSPTDWRGTYRDYLLRVSKSASRPLMLEVSTDQAGVQLEIWINSQLMAREVLPNTSGTASVQTVRAAELQLGQGMDVLRIKIVAGNRATITGMTIP